MSASFDISWHAYLACSLQYVIVSVDGRGTGYKGRALRNPVKGNLGFWETRDQINAARSVSSVFLKIGLWLIAPGLPFFVLWTTLCADARRRRRS